MNEDMQEAAKPRLYGPIPTVLITFLIFVVAQISAALLIGLAALIFGWNPAQAGETIQKNPWATFGFVFLVETVTLAMIYMFLQFRKANFRSLGISNFNISYVAIALVGVVVYFILNLIAVVVIKSIFPELKLVQDQNIGFDKSTQGLELVPVFLSLVILPPVTEEIVARGFLFGGLRTKLPFVAAAIITSIMFGAAHLGGSKDGLLWIVGIDTFVLSMVLCYLREKTGSLWPSIIVHAIKNGIAFVVLFHIIQYFR